MSTAVPAPTTLERVLHDYRALAPAADHPEQHAARERAMSELTHQGWPTTRDEQWRYANLRSIERIPCFQPPARPAPSEPLAGLDEAALPPALPGFTRLLFIDGVRHGSFSLPPGVSSHEPEGAPAGQWQGPQRLGWLAELFATDPVALRCSGSAALELLFLTSAAAAGRATYPRLRFELAPGSAVQLVERHLGGAVAPALVALNLEIDLARGASLTHDRLQQCAAQVAFTDSLAVEVAEQAQYRVRQITLGAHSARSSARVRLAGREASLAWHAIGVGRGEQVHDTALQVLHAAPATRSEQLYRGIADERARLAFSSHVRIDAQGAGSDARQSLRGLIEGAAAEIDLRPRLEISIDEVRAAHGATTGRLDENLLFYLLARGLDRPTARALLKWAFLGDALRAIALPQLRAEVERLAAGALPDVLAVGAVT